MIKNNKYLLTIVIVTYKSDLFIDDCINSIYKYNDLGDNIKIIVVDNSPIDYPMLNRCIPLYKDVVFVENSKNDGFGAANNIGAKLIDSEYILFLNNDTELVEPIFSSIIDEFKNDNKIGCVGIHQLGKGKSYFIRDCINLSRKERNEKTYNERIHFLSGAFLFFTREAFEITGGFDENIFMYYEESDILNRLIEKGYKSKYINELKFVHKIGNRRSSNIKLSSIATKSFCYYMDKFNIKDKKFFLNQRLKTYYKRLFYFIIKLNFTEALKQYKIIKQSKTIFKNYFSNESN